MLNAALHALQVAFAMGWEILWPLILGFALSAIVQAVVSHREMARLLPDDRPRSIATALAARSGVIVVLLRGRCDRTRAVPQGRRFHRSHGVRNGLHQSRRRARHYHAGVPRLAAHIG